MTCVTLNCSAPPRTGVNPVRKSRRTPHDRGHKGAKIGSFCAWDGETLILNVLGKPGAGRDAIGEVTGNQLNISVTEAPVAGRATDHMVRFLSAQFRVAVDDIEVVFGRFNVNKQLRIRSPRRLPPVISEHLSREPSNIGNAAQV